jgi:AP endonuclease-2
MKRRVSELCKMEHGDIVTVSTCERKEEPVDKIGSSTCGCDVLPSQDSDGSNLKPNELSPGSSQETSKSGSVLEKSITQKCNESKKKARNSQSSQLSIRSFFQKSTNLDNGVKDSCIGFSNNQGEPSQPNTQLLETSTVFDDSSNPVQDEVSADAFDPDLAERNDSSRKEEKSNVASQEWQRIQKLMQSSIPLCKGHKEPCIARVVKKQGANFGRRFYTCTRAEVSCFHQVVLCILFLSLKIIRLHCTMILVRKWLICFISKYFESCSSVWVLFPFPFIASHYFRKVFLTFI